MTKYDEWHCVYQADPRTVRWLIPVLAAGYLGALGGLLAGLALVVRLISRLFS